MAVLFAVMEVVRLESTRNHQGDLLERFREKNIVKVIKKGEPPQMLH